MDSFDNKMIYERRRNVLQLFYGVPEDIEKWMSLVTQVRCNFPGLETQEKLNEHRATVLKFMGKRQAVCVKEENEIVGVMLFSRGHNFVADALVEEMNYPNQKYVHHPIGAERKDR